VQFGEPEAAIPQPDPRDALHLPPAALAIQAPQPRQFANLSSGCDCLDAREVADKFEVHPGEILSALRISPSGGRPANVRERALETFPLGGRVSSYDGG